VSKLGIGAVADAGDFAAAPRAYHIDMQSLTPLLILMFTRSSSASCSAPRAVTLSALQVAGSVIAQQLGLGFVTAIDPTQGQQGLLIGNFLTILGLTLLFATDAIICDRERSTTAIRSFRRANDVERRRRRPRTRAFAAASRSACASAPFLVFAWSSTSGLACWHG